MFFVFPISHFLCKFVIFNESGSDSFSIVVRDLSGRNKSVGPKFSKTSGTSLFWHSFFMLNTNLSFILKYFLGTPFKNPFFCHFGVKMHFLAFWSSLLSPSYVFQLNLTRTGVYTQFTRVWRPYGYCKWPKTGQKWPKKAKKHIFSQKMGVT